MCIAVRKFYLDCVVLHNRRTLLLRHSSRTQRIALHRRVVFCEGDDRTHRYVINLPHKRRIQPVAGYRIRSREDGLVVIIPDLESVRQFRRAREGLRNFNRTQVLGIFVCKFNLDRAVLRNRRAGLRSRGSSTQRIAFHRRVAFREGDDRAHRHIVNLPHERRIQPIAGYRVRSCEDGLVVIIPDLESIRQFRCPREDLCDFNGAHILGIAVCKLYLDRTVLRNRRACFLRHSSRAQRITFHRRVAFCEGDNLAHRHVFNLPYERRIQPVAGYRVRSCEDGLVVIILDLEPIRQLRRPLEGLGHFNCAKILGIAVCKLYLDRTVLRNRRACFLRHSSRAQRITFHRRVAFCEGDNLAHRHVFNLPYERRVQSVAGYRVRSCEDGLVVIVRDLESIRQLRRACEGLRHFDRAHILGILVCKLNFRCAVLHNSGAGLFHHSGCAQRIALHRRVAFREGDHRTHRHVFNLPHKRRIQSVAGYRVRSREDCAVIIILDLESVRHLRRSLEGLRHFDRAHILGISIPDINRTRACRCVNRYACTCIHIAAVCAGLFRTVIYFDLRDLCVFFNRRAAFGYGIGLSGNDPVLGSQGPCHTGTHFLQRLRFACCRQSVSCDGEYNPGLLIIRQVLSADMFYNRQPGLLFPVGNGVPVPIGILVHTHREFIEIDTIIRGCFFYAVCNSVFSVIYRQSHKIITCA